jgi:exoribonuclease-2
MQAPSNQHDHRALLRDIARRAMIEHHLAPEFPPHTLQDVALLTAAVPSGVRDLRDRLWCSIDNDDSMDLDQLTVSSPGEGGAIRILVAVADVDVLVPKDSSIDHHARQNTTSVYTAAQIFPMLPERLSTDLTSLAFGEDRAAIVIDMAVAPDGTVADSNVYAALVHNRAKLAYNSVADWLDGRGPMPAGVAAVAAGMEEQLRVQDRVAALMDTWRHAQGALEFETIEARAVFDGHSVHALQLEQRNRAKTIIENFMIGANGATARFLAARRLPSLRRIVAGRCRPSPMARRCSSSWRGRRRAIRCGFRICRCPSSSCSARASMSSNARGRRSRDTSAWRCATIRIRRRRTGAFRIS